MFADVLSTQQLQLEVVRSNSTQEIDNTGASLWLESRSTTDNRCLMKLQLKRAAIMTLYLMAHKYFVPASHFGFDPSTWLAELDSLRQRLVQIRGFKILWADF